MGTVTIKQAEKVLPAASKILLELQALNHILNIMEEVEIEIDEPNSKHFKFVTKFNKSLHKMSYEFYCLLEKLELKGCLVKDIEDGVLVFPAILAGREVFLSWQFGEENIGYWHEIDEDFEDRRKIVELTLF